MGRTPTGVDGLEIVCRHLVPFNNGSDTMTERQQHHSLLDWLIRRCNHQWQFINLVGTSVTPPAVFFEEVINIMNTVKDDVTDDDIVGALEKRGTVTDCHMNFVVRNIGESSDQEEKDEEGLIFESGGGGGDEYSNCNWVKIL